MELTPIRIPGKKRQRRVSSKGDGLGERPASPATSSHKKARDATKTRSSARASKIRKRPLLIEDFPLEILEHIFILSENVSLVFASRRIAAKLSGESTRLAVLFQAFAPTWNMGFGCIQERRETPPEAIYKTTLAEILRCDGCLEDIRKHGGSPDFQSALLACRWVTVDVILQCWDRWTRLHAGNRFYQTVRLWDEYCWEVTEDGDSSVAVEDAGRVGNFRLPGSDYFTRDYAVFRLRIMAYFTHTLKETQTDLESQPSLAWIEVHPDTAIPDLLLSGPWDEKASQKLFWLYRAGARLSPDQTWELTVQGFRVATAGERLPDLLVVRLFWELGVYNEWPGNVMQDERSRLAEILQSVGREMRPHFELALFMITALMSEE